MKWVIKDPVRGDMIRVELGGIYHVGIYVSDDEVIQFGLAPSRRALLKESDVEVLSSDVYEFLAGGFLEVAEFDRKERKKNRKPDEIVDYARSKLGMRGYNIFHNNCEHFANECVTGKAVSNQAERIRALFRSIPIVDVYLAHLPDKEVGESLTCAVRQAEIDKISNDRVKREKYYAWKLLGYGLERSFGMKIADLDFVRDDSGRYSSDKVEFSISHSGDMLTVAVSRAAVGVDIEPADARRLDGMAERIMTPQELEGYNSLADDEKQLHFVKTWTAKEALFKASHTKVFEPATTDTIGAKVCSFEKNADGKLFILSVATGTPEKIRFFENVEL